MSDLSNMSDDELKALYAQQSSPTASMSDDQLKALSTQQRAEQRSTSASIARGVAMPAEGFNESLAQTLGFLPDMVGAGMRGIGLPSSAPGQYTDWARKGLQMVTGAPAAPETTTEKVLYGAGKGLGDAAAVAIPAAGIANATRAGSMVGGMARALAAQPATQAAAGAASGAVGEATDSPTASLATALLTPMALKSAGRAVLPIRPNMPAETQRLIGVADMEGIPLTPGQRTGSKPLQLMEDLFSKLPFTSGPQAKIQQAQRDAVNSAVGQRAGIASNTLTPDVLAQNNARLGGEFNRISQATTVNLDNQFLNDLADVHQQYGRKLPSQMRPAFDAYIDDITQHGNQMPGTVYQTARSDLSRQARAVRNSDPTYSQALKGLRNALDDAFTRSAPKDMSHDLETARTQYAAQKTIEKAMSGAGEAAATGNIPPAQLRAASINGDPGAYARGEGDLNDLARVGQAFLKPMSDSNTAQRNYIQGLMTGVLPGGAGGTALLAGANPMTAAAMAGATMAGPRMVQQVYNQPWMQHYLTNGIPGLAPLAQHAPQMNSGLVAALLAEKAKNAEIGGVSQPQLAGPR